MKYVVRIKNGKNTKAVPHYLMNIKLPFIALQGTLMKLRPKRRNINETIIV